jgi:uncharacterized protein YccT (UPF0319 family)
MALKLRLLLIFASLIACQACTPSGPVHVYSGQHRPNVETARLLVPGPITVTAVDGKQVEVPSLEDDYYEIFLLPGLHRIDFRYELYWGDATSGGLVFSDVVGVETRFNPGMSYELTYAEPADEEAAMGMANKFKATLVEQQTGRRVDSRTTTELNVLGVKSSLFYTISEANQAESPKPTSSTTDVTPPPGIDADTAAREDAVKRLKFWWLIADEKERDQFREWMKSVDDSGLGD